MGLRYEDLEELCNTVGQKIAEANEKIRMSNNDITGGDLEYLDRLTHVMKSIKTTMAMMKPEGYGYSHDWHYPVNDGGRYYGGNSYASGRYAKRDGMGRYSRMSGYTRDMSGEDIAEQLRDIMEDVPDEKTRQEFKRLINKVENM